MVGAGWQIAAWQRREADGRLFSLCRQELSHRRAGCASESRRRGQPGFLLKEKRGRLIGGNQTGERAARWGGKGRRRCSTGCGREWVGGGCGRRRWRGAGGGGRRGGRARGGGWACWRGRGLDNVFCERRWRSVKCDNIYLNQYDTVRQLQAGLRDDFDLYNHGRPKVSTIGLQLKSKWRQTVLLPIGAGRIGLDVP